TPATTVAVEAMSHACRRARAAAAVTAAARAARRTRSTVARAVGAPGARAAPPAAARLRTATGTGPRANSRRGQRLTRRPVMAKATPAIRTRTRRSTDCDRNLGWRLLAAHAANGSFAAKATN